MSIRPIGEHKTDRAFGDWSSARKRTQNPENAKKRGESRTLWKNCGFKNLSEPEEEPKGGHSTAAADSSPITDFSIVNTPTTPQALNELDNLAPRI